ncbi:nucleotidyltransferase domain-containing protein [Cohnella faecalis]|uniref:Aminoglycoside adenylyltransferase n=1 Tax=Cohnella faecalis TaxID=2315694 RepID=A0A398CLR2_9BACL|nr:hypothetical protein [Cohnella faecalis]RIE03375.1 hypothetical protein D3H35_11900 [Cohnella faecalis]
MGVKETDVINSPVLDNIESVMKTFTRPWFIAGGWSIDLAVGEKTRNHKDMDICIFREDVEYALEHFQGWDVHVAVPGEHRLERVNELGDLNPPRYCLHLFKGDEFLEILLTERRKEEVIFRKNREINMHISDFIRGHLPRLYVNPAWQLLFKSLSTREEDEHDFRVYRGRVKDTKSKKWLLDSMIKVKGNAEWIEKLRNDFSEGG